MKQMFLRTGFRFIVAIIVFCVFACVASAYASDNSKFIMKSPVVETTTPDCLYVPAGERDLSPYVEAYMESRYGRGFYIVGRMTENDIGGLLYMLRVSGDKYDRMFHVSLMAVRGGYTVRDDYMPAHVATAYKNVLTGLCERYFEGARASVIVQAHPERDASPQDALSQKAVCWITLQDGELNDAEFAEFLRATKEFFTALNPETSLQFMTAGGKVIYRIKGGELNVIKTL